MTKKVPARYTLEFKQQAVRLVTGGQRMAAAARLMGVVGQTQFISVQGGKPKGADSFRTARS